MFGERLKLARKRSGLSLRELSSHIGGMVSAQAIGKYERGEMMPGSSVAIALAEELDVPLSYLLSPTRTSLSSVEFRKLASTRAREQASVEADVLDNVDRYLQVEAILGIASPELKPLKEHRHSINSVEDAENAAEEIRSSWNLGVGLIPDMTSLLEERGIKVFNLRLPASVDGLSCQVHQEEASNIPVVVCSTSKSIERQRFTIAHELGHMVMDIPSEVHEEKACHRFAGAFLVPRSELIREVGRRRLNFGFAELIEIKHLFGISAFALVVRMRELGIITEATQQMIFNGIGKTWKTDEPEPLEKGESSTRFRRLCLRALAENEISESKAAELLRLPVTEIERIMAGAAS